MTIDTAKALDAAASYIERNGWTQGTYGHPGNFGPTCAEGALFRVADGCAYASIRALRRWVEEPRIPSWNDAPGQTKENVIATMRACAAIWRAKHEERQSEAPVESSAETVSA